MSLVKEINYTICPVANAAYIADKRGFLKEGLANIGYNPVRLQTLSADKWAAHYTYENERLFREGGNTPPIWSKSRGKEVVLIGLNLIPAEQAILVRKDSDIQSIEQLKGRKIAVPYRRKAAIDHQRTSVLQGFENVFYANGIGFDEVEWVTLPSDEEISSIASPDWKFSQGIDFDMLDKGEVDAVFVKLSAVEKQLDTGKYRRIYHITKELPGIPPVNNEYPNVLTVSRRLAEEEPQVVVEFVKQTVLAARWAANNKAEAEKLLAEQTLATVGQYQRAYPSDYYQHLEPNFSEEGLKALDIRSHFLYDHGFLEQKVDIYEWADQSFLKKALEELQNEKVYSGKLLGSSL